MLTPMPPSKSNSRPAPFTPDDRQREAIEHVHGPMLVVAGAGTGKTSVLTHRIERLVREGHAQPHEILALTYTVNAAREMRDRVGKLLGGKEVTCRYLSRLLPRPAEARRTRISASSTKKISGSTCAAAFASCISSTTSAPPTLPSS